MQWIVYIVMRLVICVVQTLPIETCARLSRALAHLAHDLLGIRKKIINDNLRHAFPQQTRAQRRRLALDMWEHVFLMICELAHVPRKIHDTNWRSYVRMSEPDTRRYVQRMLSPRPAVVVSGHFGNFEVGGVVGGLLGFPTFTVARPLDNPYLHRFITKFREATGQFMVPKKGSSKQLDAILSTGGTMVLLADQSAGPKGVFIDFFGRPASCHKAVALYSLVNRAPMLLAYSRRRDRPMQFEIGVTAVFDPLTDECGGVRELTQWYNHHLERTICTAPGQYWWLHNRWKYKPHWDQSKRKQKRLNQRSVKQHGHHAAPPPDRHGRLQNNPKNGPGNGGATQSPGSQQA